MGVALSFLALRDGARRPLIAVLHGVVGAVGLGLLLWMLRGPRLGDAMGAGSFGIAAAVLFAVALVLGPFVKRTKGLVLAVHASLAITGFVLVLAWTAGGG